MKIGYKGFDKDLKCRKEQFEVGKVYTKECISKPRVCSSDGYHYCNKLRDVFTYYSLNRDDNRFCIIEILGDFTDAGDKSVTNSFRIIEEIPRQLLLDHKMEDVLNLNMVKDIQTKYPMLHVGGSVGLFLHGIRLDRWAESSSSDIDMVSPYYITIESDEEHMDYLVQHLKAKPSSNDFDETVIIDGIKMDYRIDPRQRYETIEYKGFKYKVSPLMTILEAKMRYALGGNSKHEKDIKNMILGKVPKNEPKSQFHGDIFPW
jgi:hypothetical protein